MPSLKEIQDEAHNIGTNIPGAAPAQRRKSSKNEQQQDKAAEKKKDKQDIDRQIRGIAITQKGKVKIKFVELVTQELQEGEEENTVIDNMYMITSKHKPHKDLLDAMKKLRKHALAIIDLTVDSKDLPRYSVTSVDIAGDLVMKQSRVTITLGLENKRTGKIIPIGGSQTTMYGDSDYADAPAMSKLIEELVEQIWLYLTGKYEQEQQLALFAR